MCRGINGRPDEYLIGDADGIHKTRSIKRRPPEEMWNRDAIEAISYFPWNPKKSDVAPQPLRLEDREPSASGSAIPRIINPPVPNARRLYITHNDVIKHGFTPGCPGCSAICDKRKPVGHNEICRK